MWPNLIPALVAAVRSFLRTVARVVRTVFHETTGVLFFLFALAGINSAWRAWHRGTSPWLLGLTMAYTAMMAAFGVAAFRSARRLRPDSYRTGRSALKESNR